MELKDLIKRYRAIKAEPKWVKETQANLLAYFKEKFHSQKKPEIGFVFYLKPIFISLVILLIIISGSIKVFAEVKNSLPGQSLYPLKRIAEKIVYKLVPEEEKTLFRAEVAEKRLAEAKKIVEKIGLKDSQVPLEVKKTANEFEKEIIALKKEIKKEKIDQLDLPIRDDKKIVKIIQEENLEKLLAETKEAIKEKNLVMALEKIGEVEKIFFEPLVEEKTEKEPEKEPEEEKITPVKPKPLPPSDFKTDLIKE